jgi:hypothetical protein
LDKKSAWAELEDWLVKAERHTCIKPFKGAEDGRGAVLALRAHCDGKGESNKRLAVAKAQVKSLFCKSEMSLNFESFIAKVDEGFRGPSWCLIRRNQLSMMGDP